MTKNTLQIFQGLQGQWKIKRDLNNQGKAEGVANFTTTNNCYHINYKEELVIKFFGQPAQNGAHQEYTFKYNSNDNTIEQWTSGGELMYALEIQLGLAAGKYLCGDDIYLANYHFIGDNKFTIGYVVKGPNKNYTIHTEFEKIDDIEDISLIG